MALYMGGVKIAGSGSAGLGPITHLSVSEHDALTAMTDEMVLSAPAYVTIVNDVDKLSKASIMSAEVCLSGCGTLQCGPYCVSAHISAGTANEGEPDYCPSRIIFGYVR